MKGTLYGVGVGPGDPELLTIKAIRAIAGCDVIAAPDAGEHAQTALAIAGPYCEGKPVVSLRLPMTRDEDALADSRKAAVETLCRYLDEGKSVAFLTLGDPTVYSTYTYLHKLVTERGYAARIIPGVPSFCAAAAALGTPLCESGQPLHVLPASYQGAEEALDLPGTKVLLKAGKALPDTLEALEKRGLLRCSMLAERVGLEGERLVSTLTGDERSGYFSVILVRDEEG